MQKFSSCLQEMVLMFSSNPHICIQIDLFTDMVARFKEYYGMSWGHLLTVFTRAFRAKRELQCIFLGKKAIIITSEHSTMIFFSFNTTFF